MPDYTDAISSIFANDEDLRKYQEAIANGASEQEALAVGDNGVGRWGADTTADIPMVALPRDTPGIGPNRMVEIVGPKGTIQARVADIMPDSAHLMGKASIDLNPAAASAVGNTSGLAPVQWRFADSLQGTPAETPDVVPQQQLAPNIPDLSLSDVQNTGMPDIQFPDDAPPVIPQDELPLASIGENPIPVAQPVHPVDAIPHPDTAQGKVTNPDGSVTWNNGVTVYPTGEISYKVAGQTVIRNARGQTKYVDQKPDKPALHDSIVKQMLDRQLSPYDAQGHELAPEQAFSQINDYDKRNGILSPAQEKIANSSAQRLNSSRNPAVAGYYKIKPKYDSIMENITAKPMGDRNGVDDAFLLNAAAGIENVDRAPTQNDYKEMLRAAGVKGNLEVTAERLWGVFNNDPKYYQDRGTRILSDAMVQQIKSNADRILAPRKDLFMKAIEPTVNQLKSHGIPLENVVPMGLMDDASSPANTTTTSSAAPVASSAASAQPSPVAGLKPGDIRTNAKGQRATYNPVNPDNPLDPKNWQLMQ